MPFNPASSLPALIAAPVRPGAVRWIGVRPARGAAIQVAPAFELKAGRGIVGDRYRNPGGPRQVTLIEAESIATIASHLGRAVVDPSDLRRNIVVEGLNLLALKAR